MSTEGHIACLRDRVFEVSKWPHYELLLAGVEELLSRVDKGSKVLLLERTKLYGDCSLLAPILDEHFSVTSVDMSPRDEPYNGWRVDDDRFISRPSDYDIYDVMEAISEPHDIVVVPNLLHHVPENDPKAFLDMIEGVPRWMVFDVALEEGHQIPNNWGYFTPYGFESECKRRGRGVEVETTGNPFTVAAHFLDNAAECLSTNKNEAEAKEHILGVRDTLLRLKDRPEAHYRYGSSFRPRTHTCMAWLAWASSP